MTAHMASRMTTHMVPQMTVREGPQMTGHSVRPKQAIPHPITIQSMRFDRQKKKLWDYPVKVGHYSKLRRSSFLTFEVDTVMAQFTEVLGGNQVGNEVNEK